MKTKLHLPGEQNEAAHEALTACSLFEVYVMCKCALCQVVHTVHIYTDCTKFTAADAYEGASSEPL